MALLLTTTTKGKTEIKVLVKYVDLLYGEVETPQKALRAWDMGMIFHFFCC